MFWQSWNKADKTLLAAAVIFSFAVCVRLAHPGNVFAAGFLFCAEAALVGGVADWFAVTALFRKPLGISYHTAILPRRRQSFINASVKMVQKEFFSKRKLFVCIRHINLLDMMLNWLEKKETQDMLLGHLMGYVQDLVMGIDRKKQAAGIAAQFRGQLSGVPIADLIHQGSGMLRDGEHDHKLAAKLAASLKAKAEKPEYRELLESFLEKYRAEKAGSGLGAFLLGLAQATDIVNFSEAVELAQQQTIHVLDELAKKDSKLQSDLLIVFYEKIDELLGDPEFLAFAEKFRAALLDELPLEEEIEHTVESVQGQFFPDTAGKNAQGEEHALAGAASHDRLRDILSAELQRCIGLLRTDHALRQEIDKFLYDLAARSALAAQSMLGSVVRSVLGRLTDEQLNHLVYDKAEPDLLWIRMNGSIVGAGIGLCLFILLQVLQMAA